MRLPLFEISMSISYAMDLVSPLVVDHHKRVAYIASSIAAEMRLSEEEQADLVMAGVLHDIGAVSLRERLVALNFETERSNSHAETGYRLLKSCHVFSRIAPIVRFHHLPWNNGKGHLMKRAPLASHILHLADRITALINLQSEILGQVRFIREVITEGVGMTFMPELVDLFKSLSRRESFWFDVVSPSIGKILLGRIRLAAADLDLDGLLSLAKLFSKIIDFRSRFTSTHSSGVAASAGSLADIVGLSRQDCKMIRIAGYFHDLGKLAVPERILEKRGRLTKEENNLIRSHPYYTYRIIGTVKNLDKMNLWASLHHEHLNGDGYPFHCKGDEIPLGSRIMAVADVFTALTEDRPYRPGMTKKAVLQTLQQKARMSELDPDLVGVLSLNYEKINATRLASQLQEYREFEEFARVQSPP